MSSLRDLSNELGHIVAQSLPRLVQVHSGRCASAAGVVWGDDQVVTSASGLAREDRIEVVFGSERRRSKLLGVDSVSDLAVLSVESGTGAKALPMAPPTRLGEIVVALGWSSGPFARLGIVGRTGGEWRLTGTRFDRYIESDIAPSRGLSGGPLLDTSGALIGLNSVAVVRGRLVTLPAESVARLVLAISAHGRVRRARLGVSVQRVELPNEASRELERNFGLIVLGVLPKSPAEDAGVGQGDVLLQLGAARLESVEDLQGALEAENIDAEHQLELLRSGRRVSLAVTPKAQS